MEASKQKKKSLHELISSSRRKALHCPSAHGIYLCACEPIGPVQHRRHQGWIFVSSSPVENCCDPADEMGRRLTRHIRSFPKTSCHHTSIPDRAPRPPSSQQPSP